MQRRLFLLLLALLPTTAFAQPRRIVVISHRGEHLRHPENTLPAYAEAIRAAADYFEVDVRTSSDGRLVLSHDDTVDRCTNGQGKLAAHTFAQLRALDAGVKFGSQFAGTRMPTFDEALALARPSHTGIYVDVKDASAADLVAHFERHQMADRVIIYCGLTLARKLLTLNRNLKVMPEAASVIRIQQLIEEIKPEIFAFDAADFTTDIIGLAKRARARVYVDRLGAADNPSAWQSAIDSGADGIQTDRPAELVEFLKLRDLH